MTPDQAKQLCIEAHKDNAIEKKHKNTFIKG